MKRTLSTTLLGALVLSMPLTAGELRRDLVPSEVKWIGHFDFEGLQRTQIWKQLLTVEELDFEDALGELEEIRQEIGIDPLTDVLSVTVFGMSLGEDDTVAMIETTTAIDRALERFSQEDEYVLTSRGGYEIHSWDDEGFAYVHRGSGDARILLISPQPDLLVEAANVVSGKSLSLAGNPTPRVLAIPAKNAFAFFAAAEGIPGIHEIEPASQIANLAQGLVFEMGEDRGEFFARANVRTADIDAALNLGDVFDGLVALGKLAINTQDVPPGVAEMMRALQVETRGNEVWIEFRYSVAGLFELFEELANEDW